MQTDAQDPEDVDSEILQQSLFGEPAKIQSSKRKSKPNGPMKLSLEATIKARLQGI